MVPFVLEAGADGLSDAVSGRIGRTMARSISSRACTSESSVVGVEERKLMALFSRFAAAFRTSTLSTPTPDVPSSSPCRPAEFLSRPSTFPLSSSSLWRR